MRLWVDGPNGEHAYADADVDDELMRHYAEHHGNASLTAFVTSELQPYLEGMVQAAVKHGIIRVDEKG